MKILQLLFRRSVFEGKIIFMFTWENSLEFLPIPWVLWFAVLLRCWWRPAMLPASRSPRRNTWTGSSLWVLMRWRLWGKRMHVGWPAFVWTFFWSMASRPTAPGGELWPTVLRQLMWHRQGLHGIATRGNRLRDLCWSCSNTERIVRRPPFSDACCETVRLLEFVAFSVKG